ncbi:MAG: hypothetical protein Q4D45_02990 [Lachnospiraceae bacterium]|nr:hypothetical protein [Lachnospiraceae bacterium]
MKRVAEIMYIVEEKREAFLNDVINLTEEQKIALWTCGVRNQQYFAFGDLILMTFEYKGHHFNDDMKKMSAYLESEGLLIEKRRRDVLEDELSTTNWWAPIKKLGCLLDSNPIMDSIDAKESDARAMLDGRMRSYSVEVDTSFDEDDWTGTIRI